MTKNYHISLAASKIHDVIHGFTAISRHPLEKEGYFFYCLKRVDSPCRFRSVFSSVTLRIIHNFLPHLLSFDRILGKIIDLFNE